MNNNIIIITLQLNEQAIKTFYSFLNHEKETEIRVCDPNKSKTPISLFCHNFQEFMAACQKYNGSWNIYAGINERKTEGKKDEDVEFITNIGHDIDAHDSNSSLETAKQQALKLKEDALKNGFNEPLIIFSGFGYWVLHKVRIENTPENVEKIKLFGAKIKSLYEAEGISFDSAVYNPSRIARIPGTLNLRNKDNPVLSFCLNTPENDPDLNLTDSILSLELPKYENFVSVEIPKGECAFMDYCLTHEIPKGERHLIISRNMSLYIYNKSNREELKNAYIQVQQGTIHELDNWLKSIDAHPTLKFPFSCGQLIKYQKKWNIPLQCENCQAYKEYHNQHIKKLQPRGWALSVSILKLAQEYDLMNCPKCNNPFIFNDQLGWFKCNTCKIKGGLKLFAKIVLWKTRRLQNVS